MNPLDQTTQLVIDLIKKNKATDFEFSLGRSSGVSTAVRLSKVETLQYHIDTSFDVSVYFGKNKGQASSVDLSQNSIKKAIESACMIAKYTQADPFNGLAPKERMAWDAPDLDLYHPWSLDAKESIEIAKECEQVALEHDEIDNSDGAELSSHEGETYYANSNGLVTNLKNTRHSLHCSLIAKRDSEMQTAYEYTMGLDSNDLMSPSKVGENAADFAQNKLGSRNLKSQKCPVIFIPRQASGLFSQLLGALSGSRQFKKTSFLLDSIGQSVVTDSISIYEDPLQLKTLGSRAFDLDGVLKKKQFFVQDGKVISYLMGQYSANQLGLKSTANAGGVSNGMVKSNFDGGLEDLTKTMNKGLIVTDLMGHGINATTGDYSRGASGFWVEEGQIQYPVSGVTIAGNLKTMLKNISYVGNDIDLRSNLKVGSTLINEMTIAGEG